MHGGRRHRAGTASLELKCVQRPATVTQTLTPPQHRCNMSQADQQQRRSGHRRSKFSLEPVASPAALLDVFQSVGDAAAQRNPAGAVLQLVRCTQAVGEAPLKLGVASSAGAARPRLSSLHDHFSSRRWPWAGPGGSRRRPPFEAAAAPVSVPSQAMPGGLQVELPCVSGEKTSPR